MLRVLVFCSLLFATVSNSPSTGTSDKGQNCNLMPYLLKLERTVAVLSAQLKSNTVHLMKNTAAMSAMKIDLRDKDAQLLNFTRSLAQMKTDVAFEAGLSSKVANLKDKVHLKFSNVLYNKGEGYDKSAGIFTVPVSGTYILWAHIMNDDSKASLHVYMYKDGVEVARGYTLKRTQYGVASISTVPSLKQGDKVWLSKRGSSKLTGENWSSYGGALLRAL